MKLPDILSRAASEPWAGDHKIPWHEPGFSARMLHEHLSQAHEGASRRAETIARHVDWIHRELLGGHPSRVLDVGCGPGLYTSRLAKLGHRCSGIDFSPASIEYARETAEREDLTCEYELRDATTGSLGADFELAMMLFGELNSFQRGTAESLLSSMHRALALGGKVAIEFQSLAFHKRRGLSPPVWHSAASGLFSDSPYLCLRESHWNEAEQAATQRDWVVDIESGEVEVFGQTAQAYSDAELHELVERAGFTDLCIYGSLEGRTYAPGDDIVLIIASKS